MPTYEYACRECGEHLEVAQSFKDDPLTTCPTCGGTLRKVFGSIGIAFKGSGFYRTDSRDASKKAKAERDGAKTGDSKSSAEASSSDSKSSDSKSSESKSSDSKSSDSKPSASKGGASTDGASTKTAKAESA